MNADAEALLKRDRKVDWMTELLSEYLKQIRAVGIDMETATIFMVGFVNSIPKGALLLVCFHQCEK